MLLERQRLHAEELRGDYLAFDFPRLGAAAGHGAPGTAAGQDALSAPFAQPRAYLSLSRLGDMKYQGARPNPLRDQFTKSLGLSAKYLAGTDLIHSQLVRAVNGPEDLPLLGKGDGITSANPELALGVTVGDCMPIWLMDTRSLAIAALHSGWQGTGILSAALALMAERWGTQAQDCAVILGPCIHSCCYGVPLERAIQYLDSFGPEAAQEGANGTWNLDLVAANIGLCQRAGVGALRVIDACTACNPGLSSYRRDGKNGFRRMLALVSR